MENKIVIEKVDPKEFGLQENEVQSIEAAFMPKIVERNSLKEIYELLLTKEITPELCQEAKVVRLKLVKVRTGIADIHKTQKAFFLAAGRFVDAWKNKETLPVTQMEDKLLEFEEYYERIEAAKVAELQKQRADELSQYQEAGAFIPENLGTLSDEVYGNYLLGVKTAFNQKKEAERLATEAEAERIRKEAEEREAQRLENIRLKEEAEKMEAELKAERVKAEEERKAQEEKEAKERAEREAKEKAEREAHEAALKAEREKAAEAQRLLEAKAEEERKAREAEEAILELELAKGDNEKIQDLINDLTALKNKYQFKNKANKTTYQNVGLLLDKVVTYVNERRAK